MKRRKDSVTKQFVKETAKPQKSKCHFSLEHRHMHKIDEIKSNEKLLHQKKKTLANLDKEIISLQKRVLDNKANVEVLDQKKSQADALRLEVSKLSDTSSDIEYLLDSCKILHEYTLLQNSEDQVLQSMQNDQADHQNNNLRSKSQPSSSLKTPPPTVQHGILAFLEQTIPETPEEPKPSVEQIPAPIPKPQDLEMELYNIVKQKSELVDSYNLLTNNEDLINAKSYIIDESTCLTCQAQFAYEDGYFVCENCGICKPAIYSEGLSYKEIQDYDFKPQFTYLKITHFDDWLRRFQAKENTIIPQEIMDKILLEVKKERISDLTLLTEDKVKKYLKKLGFNKYYDHVIHIIHRINKIPPLQLTPEIENKLRQMFLQIQEPFEKFKPSTRKNFLSYSYVLYKLFQILKLQEYCKYFTLLKSPDKLRQQDEIFKKIVEFMAQHDDSVHWAFVPSI